MIAAIPFYELRMLPEGVRVILGSWQTVVPTFGIPIDPWATLVCLGVLLGMEVSRARAIRMGLDTRDIVDGIVFTVLLGFVGAHVLTVVAYYPERLKTDGIWALLRVWQGFSSTGGFLGGIAALLIFYKWVGYWYLGWKEPRDVMRFADLIAYGFPIGWLFGRAGCAVVHDHIGSITTWPIGVNFPTGSVATGVRHELGLYEMVLTLPMMALFYQLGKKDRPPGFFLGLFFVLYAPMRFGLDFLRNNDLENHDARYAGMTPAQYGMFLLLAFGLWLVFRPRPDFHPWALDFAPDQGRRALGLPAVAAEAPTAPDAPPAEPA